MSDGMTADQARAIDEWIIGRVTLIADNDGYLHHRLTGAAVDAVTEGMGTGYGQEAYEAMWHRGAGDRYEWTAVVGLYVADALTEMITEEMPDDMWRMILIDLLTLTDTGTRDVLGEHYLPDPRDIDWPPVECDVCGQTDDGCTPDECVNDEDEEEVGS